MTPDDVKAQAAAMLAPISDAKPGGENASYDPDFDAIRSEVTKLDSPTGGEIDWASVARGSQAMLTGKSKDLLIASYMAYAMLETKKLEGLAVGLAVLEGLLDQYWETMFPPLKRKRGRGNALGWLIGRLEIALPTLDVSAADRPTFDLVAAGYKSMGAKAREKLEDHAPAMRSVSDALQRIDLKLPKAAAAAPTPPPPAPPPPPTPAAAPPPTDAAPTPPAPAPAPAAAASEPPAPPPAPAPAAATPPAPAEPEAPPQKDLVAEAAEAAKAWLEPLGDPAHGSDARYDPEYVEIRTEVTKLDSPGADGDIQWDQVARLADELLKTKSKDLLVASYLTFSWMKTKGLPGLNLGLSILTGLLEGFEALWPKRPRGRGNALSWLSEQLERNLASLKLQAKDRDDTEALKKTVRAFGLAAREKLEDHAPSIRPLEDRVQRMLLTIPKPAPPKPKPEPPKPKPEPPKPTPQAAAPTPAAPKPAASAPAMPAAQADVGSAEEVGKYLLETGRALVKAGNLLRRAQLSSSTAYRLLRMGLWLHLDKAPPAGPGGKTQIPPLPPARRNQLTLMQNNEKWPALLEETESGLMQFRFCLDLQRLSATALQRLGSDYEPARQALLGEVASLLRRMPELPDLSAGDGSPLADEETRAWLASDVAAAEGGGGGGGPSDDPGEEFAKIAPMVKGGKLGDAMKLAKELIAATGSPRMRFIQRLALAQACLESGQPKLARSMYAALDREMTERGLVEWEPGLASRCLEGLVRAIRAAAQKGSPYPAADAAFERLCHVDPSAAARFAS